MMSTITTHSLTLTTTKCGELQFVQSQVNYTEPVSGYWRESGLNIDIQTYCWISEGMKKQFSKSHKHLSEWDQFLWDQLVGKMENSQMRHNDGLQKKDKLPGWLCSSLQGRLPIATSSSLQARLVHGPKRRKKNNNLDTLFQQMRNDKCINHSGSVAPRSPFDAVTSCLMLRWWKRPAQQREDTCHSWHAKRANVCHVPSHLTTFSWIISCTIFPLLSLKMSRFGALITHLGLFSYQHRSCAWPR